MSSLHRNAWLPDESLCLKCGKPVEMPDDYCQLCAAIAQTPAISWPDTIGLMLCAMVIGAMLVSL